VLPAAGVGDCLPAPHAGGAVEVEEVAGTGACAVLQDEVAVEEDRFDLGEQAVVAVEMRPAGLHHADFGLVEVVDDVHQPIGRGDEICVEDGDQVALGYLQACVESSCLEAVTIFAVHVDDGVAEGGVTLDDAGGYLLGFVGGVVEKLNLKLVGGVLHGADGFYQPVDDELLVVDGQLHGDARQFGEVASRLRIVVLLVLEIEVDQCIAVNAVDRKEDHDRKVGEQQRCIETVPAVEALEGLVGVLRLEEVAPAGLRGEECQIERRSQPKQYAGDQIQTGCNRSYQNTPPVFDPNPTT